MEEVETAPIAAVAHCGDRDGGRQQVEDSERAADGKNWRLTNLSAPLRSNGLTLGGHGLP